MKVSARNVAKMVRHKHREQVATMLLLHVLSNVSLRASIVWNTSLNTSVGLKIPTISPSLVTSRD
jgi:hypothetical protein